MPPITGGPSACVSLSPWCCVFTCPPFDAARVLCCARVSVSPPSTPLLHPLIRLLAPLGTEAHVRAPTSNNPSMHGEGIVYQRMNIYYARMSIVCLYEHTILQSMDQETVRVLRLEASPGTYEIRQQEFATRRARV